MKSFLIAILFAGSVFAEEATLPSPKVEQYILKKRSTFTLSRDTRAPFWPIGWVKSNFTDAHQTPVAKGPVKQKFEIQPEHFNVTSVLVGRPALATVNGRSFAEGDALPVIAGEEHLRVILKAVRDGGVWLEHGERQIYVPIRRQEVDQNHPAEKQPQSAEFAIRIGAQK
ncbi:MAG: hypothetical protein WCO71_13430 [Pseudomonadota bacterium]